MTNYHELPLFPLNTVLFPDMPLPLHVFEPRYLEMMDYCRRERMPFGVVLIQSGPEVGGPSLPFSIGTMARVTHREPLDSGRLNIVATGEARFRIIDLNHDKSYMTAVIEAVEDSSTDAMTLSLAYDQAAELFRTYLRRLYLLANRHVSSVQIPGDPALLSYSIASAVQVPLLEKQRLLEYSTIEDRLMREIEILTAEVAAQEFLCEVHAGLPDRTSWEIAPINCEELRQLTSRN
jgi:Lon protease-like protein